MVFRAIVPTLEAAFTVLTLENFGVFTAAIFGAALWVSTGCSLAASLGVMFNVESELIS